jgi:hypothetical protein
VRPAGALLLAGALVGGGCAAGEVRAPAAPPRGVVTLAHGDRLACCRVVPLDGDGYLALGTAQYADGRARGFVARLGPAGERRWARELPLGGRHVALVRAALAPGPVVYAAGGLAEAAPGGRGGTRAALVVRLEPDGAVGWARPVPGLEDAFATAVAADATGLVVAGHARDGRGERVVFAAALDPAGAVRWRARAGPYFEPDVDEVRALRDGGWVLAGSFGLIRLGRDGAVAWAREATGVSAVRELLGGDLGLVARATGAGERGLVIARLSASGDLRWQRRVTERAICWVSGFWLTAAGSIVASANPCDAAGTWLVEVAADGAPGGTAWLGLPPGANALEVQPAPGGGLVAGGAFRAGRPDAGKGWVATLDSPLER